MEWWFVLSVTLNILLSVALINKHKENKVPGKKYGTVAKAVKILAKETR